jgi:hypothetical protein
MFDSAQLSLGVEDTPGTAMEAPMDKKVAESTVTYGLSRDTYDKLIEIADTKDATVREVIDEIVQKYLNYGTRGARSASDPRHCEDAPLYEKRSFFRKQGEIPAILQTSDSKRNFNARSATIRNLSMGGALFTVQKTSEMETLDDSTPVEIIFYLNKQDEPLILQGRPRRLEREMEKYHIGVEFVDCEFTDYKELARYVLQ